MVRLVKYKHQITDTWRYWQFRLYLLAIWPEEIATTKQCPRCGNSKLLLLRTLKKKLCIRCKGNKGKTTEIKWELEEKQKPL
jgi:ribosomal protein S27AE